MGCRDEHCDKQAGDERVVVRQLERQALRSLGHPNWRLGVLDCVRCLALAALPDLR